MKYFLVELLYAFCHDWSIKNPIPLFEKRGFNDSKHLTPPKVERRKPDKKDLVLSLLLAIYHEFICKIKEIEERSGDSDRQNKRIYFFSSGKVRVAPNQPMTVTMGTRERISRK